MYKLLFLILSFLTFNTFAQNVQVQVKVQSLKTPKGQIVLKIFKTDQQFQDEKPWLVKNITKAKVVNGEMIFNISLSPGEYGFAMIDDENADSNMEYNFIGMPKEGFGFSNYVLKGLSKPKLQEFKFKVENGKAIQVIMKVTYL